nr:MAG: internal scaffolding protein [Microviridae sp.]
MPKFGTRYDRIYQPEEIIFEESITQQHFKDECDINKIMERYEKTGIIDIPEHKGMFGDFSEISDYQTMHHLMQKADEQFMSLDAKIRSRFNNNAGQLLQFISNTDNREEAIALGLIEDTALSPEKQSQEAEKPLKKAIKHQKEEKNEANE